MVLDHRTLHHQTTKLSLPLSRLVEHPEHPEHPVHLHFFSHACGLPAHQGLHDGVVSVVIIAAVVVAVSERFSTSHAQQGCSVKPFIQVLHLKTPLRKMQEFICISNPQVGSGCVSVVEDMDAIDVTVGTGVGDGVDTGIGVVDDVMSTSFSARIMVML